MTALSDYQRLEAPGIWRSAPGAQRRDVDVTLGDATITIYDSAGRPLAHWSLAALERANPGAEPAVYVPGPDHGEELEIDDGAMVAAIERIRAAVSGPRRRGRRRRILLAAASLAALAALVALLLPAPLARQAASIVPPAKRADIGARILDRAERRHGPRCDAAAGAAALARLRERLLPGSGAELVVLPGGPAGSVHLPGGLIALDRRLVEEHDTPDVVAGYVLAERLRASRADALAAFLEEAGPLAAARLAATGDVPDSAIEAHADAFLARPPAPLDDGALLAAFREARIPAAPYARASGTALAADGDGGDWEPALTDFDWLGLRAICDG